MVLRANDGRPDMWPGLENEFTTWMTYQANYTVPGHGTGAHWGIGDIREDAYRLSMTSYCALFDPNFTMRSTCKTALSSSMNNLWNLTQESDGSWKQFYGSQMSNTTGNSTVNLVNGSTAVSGNGTGWQTSQFPTHIIFYPGTANPVNFAAQEPIYYTATFVDSTHLTLDKPYQGTSGTKGWAIGYAPGASSAVGWGTQPFIIGILGLAFNFMSQAIADTDPTNSALARQYVIDIANWEKNVGYRPAVKGMEYFAGSVDCMPPIDESWTWCNGAESPTSSRTLSAESLRSVMLAYSYSGDSALKTFGDLLYNAMYGKAGYCPSGSTVCVPDGQYITDLDDGLGWYMIGTPPIGQAHKWFGMFFGIGAGADWPAYRVGGAQPTNTRLAYVGFNPGQVGGATQVRVTTMAPNGETAQTVCTSSPCGVSIDDQEGDYLFLLEYLSASGAVLATSEVPAGQG
jgi:hypothetical protein